MITSKSIPVLVVILAVLCVRMELTESATQQPTTSCSGLKKRMTQPTTPIEFMLDISSPGSEDREGTSVEVHQSTETGMTTVQGEDSAPIDYCQTPSLLFDDMKDVKCRGVSVSCSGFCGQISRDFTMACSCDRLCSVYGDCCLDFESACPDAVYHTSPQGHIPNINSGVCVEKNGGLGQSTLLIGQCGAGWQDQETERRCHLTIETIYGLVPVTDDVTTISYRNKYCAKCNGISEDRLILWPTNITCHNDFQPSSLQELFAGLDVYGCLVQLFPPDVVQPTLRLCEKSRDNCTLNECDNDKVQQLCKAGISLRLHYGTGKTIYKNPFCALCQGHAEDLVSGSYSCGNQRFSVPELGVYSFSLLMDFGSSECEDCNIEEMVNGSAGICAATDTLCQEAFWKSSSYSSWLGLVSILCLSLSMVCMLCRIIAHPLVKVYHNLPNEMQLSLVVAMFMMALCFLLGPTQIEHKTLCAGVGILMHWMLLASFLWMNAIAYDMFKVFSSIISQTRNKRVKFLTIYSCYSWILSAIIVFTCLSLDLADMDTTFRPYYGVGVCWIAQRNSLIAFVGAPIAAVIMVNALFYVRTYIYLHSALNSAKLQKCRTGGNEHSFSIYVKLFVLMGLTWVLGYIAAFTKHDLVWTLFIIFNAGQGVFVSLPSLLSKQVRRYLKVKLGLRNKAAHTEQSTSQVYITAKRGSAPASFGSEMSMEMVPSERKVKTEENFGSFEQESYINAKPDPNFI